MEIEVTLYYELALNTPPSSPLHPPPVQLVNYYESTVGGEHLLKYSISLNHTPLVGLAQCSVSFSTMTSVAFRKKLRRAAQLIMYCVKSAAPVLMLS